MKKIASIAAIAGLIGCTNMTPQQQGTVTGTAIGAATGQASQLLPVAAPGPGRLSAPLPAALLVTSRAAKQ